MNRIVLYAGLVTTLFATNGCGLLDSATTTPSTGGNFTASISGGTGANNDKSDFTATTVDGSWTASGGGGILTVTTIAVPLTSANTQSITINLGSPTKLAVGEVFTVGASQNGAAAYAVVTYAETNGSDNSKTKGWAGMTGTAKIDSISGKTIGVSISGVAMNHSAGPATGTFNLSGSGSITSVGGL